MASFCPYSPLLLSAPKLPTTQPLTVCGLHESKFDLHEFLLILLCQLMEPGFRLNSIYKAYVFRMCLTVVSIPYWHHKIAKKKKTVISSNYRGSHTAPWQGKKKCLPHSQAKYVNEDRVKSNCLLNSEAVKSYIFGLIHI